MGLKVGNLFVKSEKQFFSKEIKLFLPTKINNGFLPISGGCLRHAKKAQIAKRGKTKANFSRKDAL